ncbi:APC family permease [Brachybacterium halotolerans subsp. kimchii]|uniref:APC family permease n=1 Tax=Brachybacterium halotolerans TaxID=2795215 RepID=UPI001E2A7625|nr:APC family permease [Brachybacterium halotolerans]UEJ83322.1 APC family permease [Brachybacterium halotolerans subsp. kimchii]
MPGPSGAFKRLVLGRAFATDRLSRERLPKRLALPTFSSDALSSVAYAPDQILLTLALAGVTGYVISWWVAVAVVLLMAVVVLTGLNTVREYPGGGGDYEVVRTNLNRGAGRLVGSALLVDYALTVAVSVAQAANYTSGILPFLHSHEMWVALVLIALIALVNLRGVRQSSSLLAIPVYLFVAAIGLMVVIGAIETFTGGIGRAPSADLDLVAEPGYGQGLTALGGALLVLRAFSSGSAALTGVEAIGNGVPSFRPPKARNAGIVLLALGAISSAMILGIIALAARTGVRYVEDPSSELVRDGAPIPGYQQLPVIGQIAEALSGPGSLLFYAVTAVTGIVLFIAANTAFNGFPNLASVLAAAGSFPKQMRVRGDRLAYSNGIILLAVASGLLVWWTGARVSVLIQMYIVGVFVSFSLGQLGMVRHFTRAIRLEIRGGMRRALRLRRVVNVIGFVVVTAVLLIVVTTKFTHGAWAAVVIMGGLWVLMSLIERHYASVRAQLAIPALADDGSGTGTEAPAQDSAADAAAEDAPDADASAAGEGALIGPRLPGQAVDDPTALPSRSHAIVLVSGLDRPTMRALSVASAARHSTLEAVAVHDEDADARRAVERWRSLGIQVPLRVLYSPYRDVNGPVLAYVRSLLKRNPRDVVIVYLPLFLVGHWWLSPLHNHSVRRLGDRLAHLPRVVVASVPWQLGRDGGPDRPQQADIMASAGTATAQDHRRARRAREEARSARLLGR